MNNPLVRVGDLAEQIRGVTYRSEDASKTPRDGFLPVLRAGNITENGLLFEDLVYVPAGNISIKQKIKHGDVVIAASSGSLSVVGKAALAHSDFNGGFGAFCKVLRPNSNIDINYFANFFKTSEYRNRISSLASGVNINNLRGEHLDEMLIPLPPLTEQRRIAAILDQADALRTKRREALAQLDSLTKSIFIDMFGDVAGHGWEMTTVAGIADSRKGAIRTGPFGSQLLHSEFVESGVAVLGIDNAVTNNFQWGERRYITQLKYNQLKKYTVHPGDVLITIMGTCGRCAVVPDGMQTAINTKHICCITTDKRVCTPEFLHSYFLLHPISKMYLSQTAKGAIMDGLNMGIIKQLPVPLPPLSLQHQYSSAVSALKKHRLLLYRSLSEIDALFSSLQHRAFRGEL